LPADLKFFKKTTMGCPVIMGRKTYESMGRVLPGRRNIIISSRSDYRVSGAEIYHSPEAALKECNEEKVFIIGGAEIFKLFMPEISEIYRTLIDHRFEADTFFPEMPSGFKKVWEECHAADDKNPFPFCFQRWRR
jgi:dihydrofolate reductase